MTTTLPNFVTALGSKMTSFKKISALLLMLLLCSGVWGQATTTTYTLTTSTTPTITGNVTAAAGSFGAGVNTQVTNNATYGMEGKGWPTPSATPVPATSTTYLQFSVTPTTGNSLNINSLSLGYATNDGYADYLAIFWSTSSTFASSTSIVTGASLSSTSGTYSNSSFNASCTSGQTLYFRVYFYFLFNSSSIYGAKSLTLTGTTASPCTTPTAQATSLGLTSVTATTLSGSFTAASPAPSGYLVVRSTSATPPTPTNGTTYAAASTALGAGTYVITGNTTTSSATTFSDTGLTANTPYYYYVFSYNSSCTGAPNYLTTSPLTANTTTCLATPTTSAVTAVSTTGFTANWSAVTGATGYSIAVATDSGFTSPISGSPFTSSTNSYALSGLTNGLTYYYKVTATGSGCNSVASTSANTTLVCAAPTSLAANANSTSQTYTTIAGAFTAATTAPTGYLVVRTSTNVQPTPVTGTTYTTGANAIGNIEYVGTASGSWTSTGLTTATTYYFWVFSYNNTTCTGGPIYSSTATTLSQSTATCPTFASTITINGLTAVAGTSYPTLSAAISDLQSCGISQPIVLEIASGYTNELVSNTLTLPVVSGMSPTNTITIRPAVGVNAKTISSSVAGPTIDINAGDYWIVDGRPGGTGSLDSANNLSIINSSTTTAGTAIQILNDATYNKVQYCNLKASYGSTTSGVVNILGGTINVTGNDFNEITYNNINANTLCFNGVYSIGATNTNNNCIISSNNIYDFFSATSATNGISISSNTTDYTINNNSIFQTASRTYTSGNTHTGISISNSSGNNFTVNNNYIGGSTGNCGGTAWTLAGTIANRFRGVSIAVGTNSASNFQGNTIANINFASSSGAYTFGGPWCGIYLNAGNANIGSVTGNTIGSSSGTGSITASITSTGGISSGIFVETTTGTVNISNNTIGSINVTGSSVSILHGFTGISTTAVTNLTINNNLIGSTSTSNSINAINIGTATTTQSVTGILNSATGTVAITNNTIANLNNAYLPSSTITSSVLRGIVSSSGTNTITGNTIRHLSTAANATGTTSSVSVIGISLTSSSNGAWSINNNTIYALKNSNSAAAVQVTGIYNGITSTTAGTVSKNLIYNLECNYSGSTINGIHSNSGISTYSNNMIRLGFDSLGTSISVPCLINGIYEPLGTDNIQHNTVYIGGTGVGTIATSPTYAFNSQQTTNTRNFQNNIFINSRSNTTTGSKHYAVRVGGTGVNPTGLTSNYNIYQATGTGAVFGYYGSADVADLTAWRTAIGQDANSKNIDPCLNDPTAAIPNLHLTNCSGNGSPADAAGVTIAGVIDDFDGETRSSLSPNDIGADAGLYGPSGVDMSSTSLISPTQGGCKTATESVVIRVINNSTSTIDFSVNPVTVTTTCSIGSYNSSATLNSGTLAAGATQDVTMAATIDMTTNGTYTFNSSTSVTGDVNTANDVMTASSRLVNSLGGTYTVGISGNYTTITAAVAAANSATCITAPVIFSLIDANYTTGETYPITINSNSLFNSTNTLTIKPASGVTASISGSSASAIIRLNAADYVTIDGTNSATLNSVCPKITATRNLTITNTNTGSSGTAVVWLQSNGTDGATNNKIQNCNILGNAITTTVFGIGSADNALSTSTSNGGKNSINNQFINNNISTVQFGIYSVGESTGNRSTGTVINLNTITTVGQAGIFVGYENGTQIKSNTISSVTGAGDKCGVCVGLLSTTASTTTATSECINTLIDGNSINNIVESGTNSAIGINIGASTSGTISISNNMISGILANGTAGDYSAGIQVSGGAATYNVYHNTIAMNGIITGTSAASQSSVCLAVTNTTMPSLNLKNNIFSNTQIGNTSATLKFACIGIAGTSFTGFTSNNNVFYCAGAGPGSYQIGITGGVVGGTIRTTFADWKTATSTDTNSLNLQPNYTSTTDLHLLVVNNDMINGAGASGTPITTDFDCASRDTTPDIGADEFTPPPAFALNTSAISICNGTTSLAVSIATGSSDYNTFTWSPNTSVSGDAANGWTFNPTTTTTYTLTATNSGNSNSRTATVTITVNAVPTAITFTPSSAPTICNGSIQSIAASGGVITGSILLSENFNGAMTGWSQSNSSTGGTPANAVWGYAQDAYSYNSETFHSNDNSRFMITNSDAQGSGGSTLTYWNAPVVNTIGYTSLSLTFYQYLKWDSSTIANVEVSTNNSSWTTVLTQNTASIGSASGFTLKTVDLTSYINNSTLYIRFKYAGSYSWYWAIDNFNLIGNYQSISWNNTSSLYTNSAATTAYSGNPTTVYAKPTSTTTYTATATSAAGCASSNSLTVNVSPTSVAGTASGDTTICAGNSVSVSLSGNTGTIQWQQSLNGTSWANVTGGSGATTSSYTTPNLTVTTYYRAVVTSGVCSAANSNTVTVTVNPLPTITLGYIDDVLPTDTSFSIPFTATSGSPDQYSIITSTVGGGVSTIMMPNFTAVTNATLGSSPIAVTIPASSAAEYGFVLTVTNSTTGCSKDYPFQFHVTSVNHGVIGTDQTICSGATPAPLTNITDGSSTFGSISYTWEQSTMGIDTGYSVILGQTGAGYSPGALTQTTYFKRVTHYTGTNPDVASDSDPVTITVNPKPQGSLSANGPFCVTGAGQLTFTATAGTGPFTVIYNDGIADRTVTNVTSGTAFDVYTTPVTATTTYSLVSVTDSSSTSCARTSGFTAGSATITINSTLPASVSIAADATTICSGTSVTFTATPTNGGSAPTYQWQVNGTNVSGQTASTYTTTSLANNDVVSVVMTSNATPCLTGSPATSNTVTMTVKTLPTASIASNNSPICSGAATFNLTGTSGAVVTYAINGGANTTTTLTSGAATVTVSNPYVSQAVALVSVAYNGCTASLSETSTVSVIATTYDGTSWSNGGPDSSKLAIFTGNYTIAADFTACSLRVTNNAVVSVSSNYNVNLNGAITVDSGSSFTLNNNSNLFQSDATAVNTGTIIVKRNTSNIVRLDHTLWSSPVTGQNLFSFSPNTLVNRFYVYNTATNSYVTTGLSNTSLFTPAKGFAVRAPNNQSATTPAQWTGIFTGVPNNGTKTFTLATDAANGYNYNLVGNPYPSALSASDFYAANSSVIGGTLYFYAHTLTMNASGLFPTGTNYATWTGLGGAAATAGDGHTAAVAPNGIIQVGQGFIVKATAAGDVTFTNAMRVANQQNQFMKAATTTAETHRMWLNLKTDTGVDVNQILVGYRDGATQGVDADLDGLSFGNTGSYFYSKIDSNNYVIQARSLPFDTTDEVPLGFNCATAGSYSISLTNTDGLFAGSQDVLVRDNLTGTDTSIKTAPYTFTSEAGVFDSRFKLVYQQALGVPSTNFTENSVIVYKNTDWFHVTTKGIEMKDIMVYDISGRLIYSQKDINATTTVLNGLSTANQVLLLKITSQEGKIVTIKVIN
jgi:hypothetical protein